MQARKEGEEQCIQLKQNNGNKRREKERGRRWKEQAKRLGKQRRCYGVKMWIENENVGSWIVYMCVCVCRGEGGGD